MILTASTIGLAETKNPLKFIQKIEALTVKDAFAEGTNIRTLNNNSPGLSRTLLTKGLKDLIEFVDANKTINSNEQLIFTVEALINDFPTLTLEEFYIVFRDIKKGVYGKLFERLKLAEISECLKKYEAGIRADYLERRNQEQKGSDTKIAIVDYEAYKIQLDAKETAKKATQWNEPDYQKQKFEYLKGQKS